MTHQVHDKVVVALAFALMHQCSDRCKALLVGIRLFQERTAVCHAVCKAREEETKEREGVRKGRREDREEGKGGSKEGGKGVRNGGRIYE